MQEVVDGHDLGLGHTVNIDVGADAVFDKSTDVDELMEFCLAMRRDDVDGGTGGSNVQ